jgi:hypothetical protein
MTAAYQRILLRYYTGCYDEPVIFPHQCNHFPARSIYTVGGKAGGGVVILKALFTNRGK